MMRKITLFFSLIFSLALFAQDYETPNTGVNYSLDDLIEEDSETFSFDGEYYLIHSDFTLAENDSLSLNSIKVKIADDVRITVEGTFLSQGTEDENTFIQAIDEEEPYDGFRFEEISTVAINHTTITHGGGLKVITPDFSITNSFLSHNVKGVSTGSVISLSHGSVLIENNHFEENDLPAVSSPSNGDVSAHIINNYIEGNNLLNENRPQLNMGTTGADTLKIIGNTIIGNRDLEMVGGISIANFLGGEINAIIEGNIIQDNRYGINIQGAGGSYVEIIDNIIEDNDTQNSPNLGGSGISINSGTDDHINIITGNEIRRNLWGITVIGNENGGPLVNLGDDEENPGGNIFSENGNNDVIYALYNNSPSTIMAKHNCWIEGEESTLEDVEEVIVHQVDDASLGKVIYDPIECGVMGLPSFEKDAISIFPNPTKDQLNFETSLELNQIEIFDMNGRKVQEIPTSSIQNPIDLNLESGVYFVLFSGENGQLTKKLIIK